MEEEPTDDDGVLVLEPAQKEHSGWYECQGLDLETMTSLSDRQELLVNGEGLGSQDGGVGWGKRDSAPHRLTRSPCPQMCPMSGCAPKPLKAERAAAST